METTRIWDSRNNRHATVEHETLKPCPFCDGMPRIDDDLGIDDMDADETVRELFEALLRRGINIGIDTSNLEN